MLAAFLAILVPYDCCRDDPVLHLCLLEILCQNDLGFHADWQWIWALFKQMAYEEIIVGRTMEARCCR